MRTLTAVTWLAVGASATAWGLLAWRSSAPTGPSVPVTTAGPPPAADWAPLMGGGPSPVAPAPVMAEDAARFQLVGVVGATASGSLTGVAVLAVDGRPARAYRVGEAVDERRVVQQVLGNTVHIGVPGSPPSVTLQAPQLPPPATGTRS